MTSSILVWTLAAPLALTTTGAASQIDTANEPPSSAIERALTDRACVSLPSAALANGEAHQRCVDAQLTLLRTDFGQDLRRLSPAERTGLDATCSRLETTHGRESYLDCVNAQLAALRVRRNRASAARSAAATTSKASSPDELAPAPSDASALPQAPAAPATTAWSSTTLVGIVLLTIAAAAGGSLVLMTKRGAHRKCRECGAVTTGSGDLCAPCRHAAADALRRAASERSDQVRAEETERRRKVEFDEEERRQQALREEEARQREQAETQRHAENARRRQEEEARRQAAAPPLAAANRPSDDAADEFNPYAVLGVQPDTTPEDIRAAYEQARSKYDLDSVAHLGVDVQEHFREKAQAVDRAYNMLAH